MARLINDSGVLGDAMTVTAETVNSVSFDKIIEAIHVVQTEMGITGTTAKEASTTIQGSITSMKGAWENFMVGLADPTQDFDRLVSNLVDSVITVSENLMPRIMAVLPQMATGITELAGELLPLIPETLNAMLPGVLEGANNLVSALLDTISSIADTAIPIITENADEIIDTLLTGLVDAVPKLVTKAADLCTALIKAILDNADIITQGAVDIVISLAQGLANNLDELIPAAVKAVLTIVDTLIYNIDELLDAAEELIKALADGLIEALPELLAKAPEIVIDLIAALVEAIPDTIEFAVELCEQIGSNIVNYDWETVGSDMYQNLHNALENALHGDKDYVDEQAEEEAKRISRYSNLTQEQIDKMIADNSKKLGEWNALSQMSEYDYSALPKWMRIEMENSGETSIKAYVDKSIKNAQQTIEDLSAARENAVSEIEKTNEEIAEALDGGAEVDTNNADSAPDPGTDGVVSKAEMLDAALKDLEAKYAIHQVTEEQYWAKRKSILEQYRNEEDAEWWKLYDKVTDHYDKLAETEAKAAQKASKEQETALKTALEDKFRELETEQLKKDYDDSWLLEQKRAYIETLDHNTDLYKDNDLKLLKEQKSYNDKALKETENAAKKQQDALEKSFDSIVKSRDSLASSLSAKGDIFQSSEETDKRTGAKKKSRSIDIEGFEKKIEAKKKLTSKITELLEKNTPDEIISELLKQDPEDALAYANDLLRSPDKLSRLSKGFENDDAYSKIIANMVTESSDDFKALGEEAGTVFGEGFMAAFNANWEEAFKAVFGDEEYTANASVKVNAANNSAAETTNVRRDYSASENSGTGKTAKASSSASQSTYKIIDLNGRYVAAVVNAENARSAKTGGG